MADDERLRGEVYAAFKNRALMYWHIFAELRRALGEPQAMGLLSRAIEARGREIGRQFARYGPSDLAGLRERCDAGGLDITLQRCPLKDAWHEAGLSEADVATLCRVAGRVDNGTFEAAGFAFSAETWQPGREGCCHLHIRPGRGH